ncbi:MAG: asparagine synthase-related protein [Campylobacterota bacterium]|nr:asparagine synthase-related protein [Campylobacterota bacterium]
MNIKEIFSNVTLYNIEALEKKLNIEANECNLSELLVLAYEKWGEGIFSHLDGDYAFAFYSAESNYYFAARDPLGIKALYYTKTPHGYEFASTITELLDLTDVLREPNINAMKSILNSREVAYENTMYDGVYRVPPGYFIRIIDDTLECIRYWYPEKIKRDYHITEDEAKEKLNKLLSQAIDKRVASLDETGFQVSGGLDSSSIVSILSKNVTKKVAKKIDSYSIGLKGLKCDEGEYVDSIIEKYSINHKKVSCEALDYHEKYALSKLYAISGDWPIMFSSAKGLAMSSVMKSDSKKVILTGQGGDELLAMNAYTFYELFIRGKFITLYRELTFVSKPWRTIKRRIIKPLVGEKNIEIIKTILRKERYKNRDKILNFSDKIGLSEGSFKSDIDAITSVLHTTVLDANFLHPTETEFNVEFRHPFYDLKLVEFSLSLPPIFKYTNGQSKWILRKAMKDILPDMINNRKDKAEFSEMIVQQIAALNLSALLDDAYIVKLGVIDQTGVDTIRKNYEEMRVKKPFHIWGLINMEYWYRFNFEKASLKDVDKKEV